MTELDAEPREVFMDACTTGKLNFMAQGAESSLYRNGKVFIRRDAAGDDAKLSGLDVEECRMSIRDARESRVPPDLDLNGFELLSDSSVSSNLDFMDNAAVIKDYYPLCEALLAERTGGNVFAFDHNVRSATGKAGGVEIGGGQNVQGPAHMVHGDYTIRSGRERLVQLSNMPSGNDTLKGFVDKPLIPAAIIEACQRFAIINVWRNIDSLAVASHPLALCDGQTVEPEDLVVFEIHYADRVGENYFSKASHRHRFYYWRDILRSEALLIKQWDSGGNLAITEGAAGDQSGYPCTFSFHSAFVPDDQLLDAPDRWSIEVRCVVIY